MLLTLPRRPLLQDLGLSCFSKHSCLKQQGSSRCASLLLSSRLEAALIAWKVRVWLEEKPAGILMPLLLPSMVCRELLASMPSQVSPSFIMSGKRHSVFLQTLPKDGKSSIFYALWRKTKIKFFYDEHPVARDYLNFVAKTTLYQNHGSLMPVKWSRFCLYYFFLGSSYLIFLSCADWLILYQVVSSVYTYLWSLWLQFQT